MPKDYIHSMDFGRSVILDGDTEPTMMDHDTLKVGWAKDRPGVDLAVVDFENDPDGFEARYLNLDRAGCNRLITTLRRARDAAFGKDA